MRVEKTGSSSVYTNFSVVLCAPCVSVVKKGLRYFDLSKGFTTETQRAQRFTEGTPLMQEHKKTAGFPLLLNISL
jgi:hypothetical protein